MKFLGLLLGLVIYVGVLCVVESETGIGDAAIFGVALLSFLLGQIVAVMLGPGFAAWLGKRP